MTKSTDPRSVSALFFLIGGRIDIILVLGTLGIFLWLAAFVRIEARNVFETVIGFIVLFVPARIGSLVCNVFLVPLYVVFMHPYLNKDSLSAMMQSAEDLRLKIVDTIKKLHDKKNPDAHKGYQNTFAFLLCLLAYNGVRGLPLAGVAGLMLMLQIFLLYRSVQKLA